MAKVFVFGLRFCPQQLSGDMSRGIQDQCICQKGDDWPFVTISSR